MVVRGKKFGRESGTKRVDILSTEEKNNKISVNDKEMKEYANARFE